MTKERVGIWREQLPNVFLAYGEPLEIYKNGEHTSFIVQAEKQLSCIPFIYNSKILVHEHPPSSLHNVQKSRPHHW